MVFDRLEQFSAAQIKDVKRRLEYISTALAEPERFVVCRELCISEAVDCQRGLVSVYFIIDVGGIDEDIAQPVAVPN